MAASTSTHPLSESRTRRDVLLTLALALGAGVAGYLVVRDPFAAGALALAPTALWLFTHQRAACALLVGAIPFAQDVTSGAFGLHIAVSDLLLVLLATSVISEAMLSRDWAAFEALRPVRLPLVQYLVALALLLALHGSTGTETAQRIELFAFPLMVGAVMGAKRYEFWALRAYVVGATFLAGAWPLLTGDEGALGVHKNPGGQFMANAILILMAAKPVRRRLMWTLPILVTGLLWTQSRGAILGIGVGLMALLLVQPGISRRRLVVQLVPLALVTVGAFRLLPDTAQERNTSFAADSETRAGYALKIRESYRSDAWEIIHAHPWSGIGVGKYLAGSPALGTITDDPHQILLLEAAEGGYLFAGSFLVLTGGALFVVIRRARRTSVGPAAVAVTVSVLTHSLVDVYWVRGTPLLGWILVGAALAGARSQERPSESQRVAVAT